MKFSIISTVLLSALVNAQTSSLEGHSLYTCEVASFEDNAKLEVNYDVQKFYPNEKYSVVHLPPGQDASNLLNSYKCQVKVADMGSKEHKENIQSRLWRRADDKAVDPFFADFQSYDAIKAKLQEWAKKYPHITEFIPSIGKSHEGRDIYGFKIAKKNCPQQKRKSIWFNGGIHAREWISPATAMYQIDHILNNFSTDKELRAIFNKFDLYITPVSNPDGYEYTRTTDRLWRKNRRNNGDGTFGVDLNRNFDEKWALIGSSSNTSSITYHGPSALSEPETQALAKFGLGLKRGYAGIDFHSYGQLILRSWGFKIDAPATNEKYLKQLGDGMRDIYAQNGYNYTSELSAGLYPAGGAMDDWMAAKAKLQAFTLELCPTDDDIGFVLPKEQIVPCASATTKAVRFFFRYLAQNYDLPPNEPLP